LPAAIDKTKLQTDGQRKLEEYQKLGLEFEYKQKDYKASVERREATIMAPVRLDIGNALQEFAKKKKNDKLLLITCQLKDERLNKKRTGR
jgi:Skp family chaperone for outer membrane proteins